MPSPVVKERLEESSFSSSEARDAGGRKSWKCLKRSCSILGIGHGNEPHDGIQGRRG